jgi:hypothetical protein
MLEFPHLRPFSHIRSSTPSIFRSYILFRHLLFSIEWYEDKYVKTKTPAEALCFARGSKNYFALQTPVPQDLGIATPFHYDDKSGLA